MRKVELMRATFTGEDGSMGYRRDRSYRLLVLRGLSGPFPIRVHPLFSLAKWCPYGSESAFKRNWSVVSAGVDSTE